MLSATFLETDAQVEGLETGADAYLTQPVEAPCWRRRSARCCARAASRSRSGRAASEWRTTFDAISDAVAVIDADGIVGARTRRSWPPSVTSSAARVEALEGARGDRRAGHRGADVFSVRFDPRARLDAASVVTLSDITAARRTERDGARWPRERSISRTLQLTLLPARLPSDHAARSTRGMSPPSTS